MERRGDLSVSDRLGAVPDPCFLGSLSIFTFDFLVDEPVDIVFPSSDILLLQDDPTTLIPTLLVVNNYWY